MEIKRDGELLTYTDADGAERCLGYLLVAPQFGTFDAHFGKVDVGPDEAAAHNRAFDAANLRAIDETCQIGQGGVFYISNKADGPVVRTWLGTVIGPLSKAGRGAVHVFERNGRVFRGRVRKGEESVYFERIS